MPEGTHAARARPRCPATPAGIRPWPVTANANSGPGEWPVCGNCNRRALCRPIKPDCNALASICCIEKSADDCNGRSLSFNSEQSSTIQVCASASHVQMSAPRVLQQLVEELPRLGLDKALPMLALCKQQVRNRQLSVARVLRWGRRGSPAIM